MKQSQIFSARLSGLDCSECARHVRGAIEKLPGVESVEVLLASQKVVVRYDGRALEAGAIRMAIEMAGHRIEGGAEQPSAERLEGFSRKIFTLLALVFGAVLFIVVLGEWLGLFRELTERVPYWLGVVMVVLSGWPVLLQVLRAAVKGRVTAHTLMTLGMLAALAVGEWATAAVVVFFMRVGDYAEKFTSASARGAVKDLMRLAPRTARIEIDGEEREVAVEQVKQGDVIVVRPGEKVPVDGEVIAGQGTIDQAAITGESMPVEAGCGSQVFAATIVQYGSIKIRAQRVGVDTTFGRVVKMVEEAETHRSHVQQFADRFSGWFLPIVVVLALLTLILRRDPMATAAVLVVACSCSIALATPIAMLASVGASARRGLLIKGGKYLELLAKAEVLLIDKTGTLTLGRPRITDIVPLSDMPEEAILAAAASVERYSEHPLAEAVRGAARERGLQLSEPMEFAAAPGMGVRARLDGGLFTVGNRAMVAAAGALGDADRLEKEGKTLLFVARDGRLVGMLAAADALRPEVPQAIVELRRLGLQRIELLTGDHESTAADLAGRIGVPYRAQLLPEDKIAVVKDYQAQGYHVVMVGDGVNDAPALAQAQVGIAMGAAGADVAIEAAPIALMREDWKLIPEVFRVARRTMGVVKSNLILTGLYNAVGLSLAAFGLLPPILAAAAQSLPDLGILANSARLLRQK